MSEAKQKYRQWIEQSEVNIPLFAQPWWLDTVCIQGEWNVALVEKSDKILAAFPYYVKKRGIFNLVTMPLLTQYMGPLVEYPADQKTCTKIAYELELTEQLIAQLPDNDQFVQFLNPSFQNWLSFYWQGYSQQTYYTYLLKSLSSEEVLWKNLRENIRREIRKAQNRHQLSVTHGSNDIERFIEINKKTFQRQNIQSSYSDDFIRDLDKACAKRQCREIFFAEDSNGKTHTGLYVVYDKTRAHYLMGGSDPACRNSGSNSLAMWEAILHSASRVDEFNFEGSMLKSVEKVFRGFGADPIPYFRLAKTNSVLLKLFNFIREIKL